MRRRFDRGLGLGVAKRSYKLFTCLVVQAAFLWLKLREINLRDWHGDFSERCSSRTFMFLGFWDWLDAIDELHHLFGLYVHGFLVILLRFSLILAITLRLWLFIRLRVDH